MQPKGTAPPPATTLLPCCTCTHIRRSSRPGALGPPPPERHKMDATLSSSLPQQCLQLIFLGQELEGLVAVGGVCSSWRTASLATHYSISLQWRHLQAFSDQILVCDHRAAGLKGLTITSDSSGGITHFYYKSRGPRSALKVDHLQKTWEGLRLAKLQPTLRALSMQAVGESSKALVTRILHLDSDGVDGPWQSLEELTILCGGSWSKDLRLQAAAAFPSLQALCTRRMTLPPVHLRVLLRQPALANLRKLEVTVRISNTGDANPGLLPCLTGATALKELGIYGCKDHWGPGFPVVLEVPQSDWLPAGLQHLTLGFKVLTELEDGEPAVLSLGGATESLESVFIFIDPQTNKGLPELPTMPQLQKIGIWAASRFPVADVNPRELSLSALLAQPSLRYVIMSIHEEVGEGWYPEVSACCALLGTADELEVARARLSFCFVEAFDEKADHQDLDVDYGDFKEHLHEMMGWEEGDEFDVRCRELSIYINGIWMAIAPWCPLWRAPMLEITYVRHDMDQESHVMEAILRDPGSMQDVIRKSGCWSTTLCRGG